MTCIVGYVKDGVVYMGGDSAGVAGLDVRERKDTKVFFVQNEFLIGYTSSFRMGQLLRFKLKVPDKSPEQDEYEYMCTSFIDSVREVLKEGGYLHSDKGDIIGTFLVGYRGRLYLVSDDLQVAENIDPYDSVGCGEKYALGALAILDEALPAKTTVTKALEVAVKFSAGVRPPFVIEELR